MTQSKLAVTQNPLLSPRNDACDANDAIAGQPGTARNGTQKVSSNAMSAKVNRPRPTKRRTRSEIDQIRDQIRDILSDENPMTVRQVFYRMVSRPDALIDKTEREYKQTIGRLLVLMRRDGTIPYHWIADNTRWMRKPRSYSSLHQALDNTVRTYRRDLWDNQDVYVEIWTEKDAIAGVLLEETREWDVPLMVSRGFSSISFLHSAAETIAEQQKPAFLYYFGDHDPSGIHIDRAIERNLRELAPDADFEFERVAVTPSQIEDWQLPTRPTKPTDSRAKGFVGDSVEVDAIPPRELRRLVRDCITRHVNQRRLTALRKTEALERQSLQTYADSIGA